jgi:hypothetical protein
MHCERCVGKFPVPACISEEIEVTTHVFLSLGVLRSTFLLLRGMQMNTQYDVGQMGWSKEKNGKCRPEKNGWL